MPITERKQLYIKSPPKVSEFVGIAIISAPLLLPYISVNDIPLISPEWYKNTVDPRGW